MKAYSTTGAISIAVILVRTLIAATVAAEILATKGLKAILGRTSSANATTNTVSGFQALRVGGQRHCGSGSSYTLLLTNLKVRVLDCKSQVTQKRSTAEIIEVGTQGAEVTPKTLFARNPAGGHGELQLQPLCKEELLRRLDRRPPKTQDLPEPQKILGPSTARPLGLSSPDLYGEA